MSGKKAVTTLKEGGSYQEIISIIAVIRSQDILGKVSGWIASLLMLKSKLCITINSTIKGVTFAELPWS